MSEIRTQRTLLEEIDARQEEVLSRLNELNQQVESLLQQTLAMRKSESDNEQ